MAISFAFLCTLTGFSAEAKVKLPSVFGNNMVLQRDKPIEIWGWGSPQLPFLMVQLSSVEEPEFFYPLGDWAAIREAQRQVAELPHTEMAFTIDLSDPFNPNNIHPRDKQPVGHRLALLALKEVYGEDILAQGPVLSDWKISQDTVLLTFKKSGEGLTSHNDYGYLQGFEIMDSRQNYHKAQASIRGNEILVSHPAVKNPQGLRYAWSDYPADANLVNSAELPASPFKITLT